MSTNFAKTLVWKYAYDVKLWRHKQHTPNANDHHMSLNETPHENFLRTSLVSGVYRKLYAFIGGQRVEKFENHWFKQCYDPTKFLCHSQKWTKFSQCVLSTRNIVFSKFVQIKSVNSFSANMQNHQIVLWLWLYASKFLLASVLKRTSLNEAFIAGKTKNWSKTFQTPENAVAETGSFDKIFISLWIEKLAANSFYSSLQSRFRSRSST